MGELAADHQLPQFGTNGKGLQQLPGDLEGAVLPLVVLPDDFNSRPLNSYYASWIYKVLQEGFASKTLQERLFPTENKSIALMQYERIGNIWVRISESPRLLGSHGPTEGEGYYLEIHTDTNGSKPDRIVLEPTRNPRLGFLHYIGAASNDDIGGFYAAQYSSKNPLFTDLTVFIKPKSEY